MRSKLTAILIMGIAALYGCGDIVHDNDSRIRLESLENELNRLTINGEWDSLFSITYPLVYGDTTDTVLKVCAALYNAQYWLYRENLDSVMNYQNIAERNLTSIEGMRRRVCIR